MTRPTSGSAVSRALRLRCPRCGQGRLFRNWFAMFPRCPECHFVYERDPGYFLGSTYINYGFTAVTLTAIYMVLHFGYGVSNQVLTPPLVAYCVVVPLVLFRYARSWWLMMDCYLDTTGFHDPVRTVPPAATGASPPSGLPPTAEADPAPRPSPE